LTLAGAPCNFARPRQSRLPPARVRAEYTYRADAFHGGPRRFLRDDQP